MRNFRRVAIAAAAAGAMASALVGASPAGAQEETETVGPIAVTPTSGPSGTVISVSGEECMEEVEDVKARFMLVAYDPEKGVGFDIVAESSAEPEDGAWDGELTVPDGADPDVDHYVTAQCVIIYAEGQEGGGDYEPVPFDVTAGDPTPTTAPEVPETPDTVAPVATPVVAQPTFTG